MAMRVWTRMLAVRMGIAERGFSGELEKNGPLRKRTVISVNSWKRSRHPLGIK